MQELILRAILELAVPTSRCTTLTAVVLTSTTAVTATTAVRMALTLILSLQRWTQWIPHTTTQRTKTTTIVVASCVFAAHAWELPSAALTTGIWFTATESMTTSMMISTTMIHSSGTMDGATDGHGDHGALGTARFGDGAIPTHGAIGGGDQAGIIILTITDGDLDLVTTMDATAIAELLTTASDEANASAPALWLTAEWQATAEEHSVVAQVP